MLFRSIRLPGLDAAGSYRVEPVLVGGVPDGAEPAPWWAQGEVVLSGAVLATAGVVMPALRPEQAVLIRAVLVPGGARAEAAPTVLGSAG